MPIQWFPGHMHAARRKLEETLADVDVLIEVLDARIPAASRNPLLETLRRSRQRPCLKLLNKADLADPARTTEWIAAFEREEGVRALAVCAKNPADVRRILPACERLAPHRSEPTKPLRLMIAGIPNVGKSTLLNALIGRKAAKVGDEPAVTKSVQRYDLPGLRSITDTPGLMWPKMNSRPTAICSLPATPSGATPWPKRKWRPSLPRPCSPKDTPIGSPHATASIPQA